MRARTAVRALRSVVLLVSAASLLGHVCAPLFHLDGQDVTLAGASVAEAPRDAAHQASCEALPRSSPTPPDSLAVGSAVLAFDVPAPASGCGRDVLAPIQRPPRFLLFATLLN
jgi:hypothetical protein